jgi:hypothetical protein
VTELTGGVDAARTAGLETGATAQLEALQF